MKKKWLVSAIILVVILLVSTWGIVVGKHAYHLYQVRQEIKGLMQGGIESISPVYAFELGS